MAQSPSLLKKLALGAVSAAAVLVVTEVAFRSLLERRFEKRMAAFTHELYDPIANSGFLYSPRPSTVRENRIPSIDGATWTCTINAEGHRQTAPVPASVDAVRVVCLGDSYTFGWAVEDEETYPSALARRLRALRPEEPPLVVNAGVPGFNTTQEAAYLEHHWQALDPDVVVLGFVMNDAEPSRIAPQAPRQRYRFARLWMLEDLKLRTGLADGPFPSRLLRFRDYLDQFAPGAPERDACLDGLRAIAGLCEERATPLVIAIFPDTTALRATGYRLAPIHEQVATWGAELGVSTIDLLDDFRGEHNEDFCVPGDGHPNARALERFARAIAAALKPHLDAH
ncbi:MAG: lysophospholipase L1-like esterase [Planctomycetota bacterium]|jgi:lysophospholipase L1-like esterase